MNQAIATYNEKLAVTEQQICSKLASLIDENLVGAQGKIWHGHPVWFLADNPIVGYSKLKAGIKLMFWSGADFAETDLHKGSGKFKDASITFTAIDQINTVDLCRWLKKFQEIQWDYKNIVKRKGKLQRL